MKRIYTVQKRWLFDRVVLATVGHYESKEEALALSNRLEKKAGYLLGIFYGVSEVMLKERSDFPVMAFGRSA